MRCLWCHNPEAVIEEIMEYSVKEVTAEKLLKEIYEDKVFFTQSGGGVTFSGGEPVLQAAELLKVVKACKEENISTAIETAGNYLFELIEPMMEYIDLFIVDCKAVTKEVHRVCTGKDNGLILQNIMKMSRKRLWVRIPIVWDVNITRQEIIRIGNFLQGIQAEKVELVPYHKMGIVKYAEYGLEYPLPETQTPTKEQLKLCCDELKSIGIPVVCQ